MSLRKKTAIILFCSIFLLCSFRLHAMDISGLTCDFKVNPLGVGPKPHFGWILKSELRNQYQTAYRIVVADDVALLDKNTGNIWDSKKVVSEQSINIGYNGSTLVAGKVYYWKARVWDKEGKASAWSSIGRFVTSLFEPDDWSGAKWISYEDMDDSLILVPGVHPWQKNVKGLAIRRPIVPLFRKEFVAEKKVKTAYLFVTGLGHYKAYINGRAISDDFLSPGWTDYRKKCLYNIYDITRQVKTGTNAIGVIVGNGFHNVNNERYRKLLITYGMPKMIGKIKIIYTDGSEDIIVTGDDWKASPSPVTYSSLFGGESYDAQLEQDGWDEPGFKDDNWKQVLLAKVPGGVLVPETAYPIKVNEVIAMKEYFQLGIDTFLYDFGQNASGIVRIKVKGKKGQTLRLWPGELIKENNFINQKATGRPHYYEYTLKGEEEEIWQPMFTLYGLRYVQVENAVPAQEKNVNGKPEILEIVLLHTFNSAPRTGYFSCSNDLFNRINRLIMYAIQSNMQSVITDCPHREKLGWLEQTYLMGGSIHYNFDVYHLYRKVVNDMGNSQSSEGLIPSIAPEFVYFGDDFTDSPEWGSAGIILPWLIYKWYGDLSVMEEAWPMMEKYLQYLGSRANGHILTHGLGDWYDLGPGRPGYAQLTPKGLTATAIYYYDVQLMAQMAEKLGKIEEKQRLEKLAGEIKMAFNNTYFNSVTKVYSTGSQTAMAVPLCVGLVDEDDREKVVQNLVDSIYKNNKALTTGDIGFHFLAEALMDGGASQLIFDMNNRDDVPGYGYQLKKGATSLTESWNALENVSNNHMMLGHIMEWFYKGLGGIQQADNSEAYKQIVIKPSMVGNINEVKSSFISPFGRIISNWEKEGNKTTFTVEIPVNTSAIVYLPAKNADEIKEGETPINELNEAEILGKEDEFIKLKIGSGVYSFIVFK